jgi:peptidoglycan/LPS O-acetylase OafA/YrhL
MDFSDAVANGIPLIALIIGLVQFFKEMGLRGQALRALSAVIGLALGVAYQISTGGVPADFAGWFGVAIYSLGLGIVASGLVDAARDVAQRVGG